MTSVEFVDGRADAEEHEEPTQAQFCFAWRLNAQDEALQESRALRLAPGAEIGNLHPIAERVVAVESHQGIHVESDCDHAGEHDDVVKHGTQHPGGRHTPEHHRYRSDVHLDVHAREVHDHTIALLLESPRGRRVDVGTRREDHHEQAHLGYVPTAQFGRVGVAEFVGDFECDQRDPEQQEVLVAEDVAHRLGELRPIAADDPQRDRHE